MKAKRQIDLYILGMVLAILTFWLFAQSMINIIPTMQKDLKVSSGILNISTSLTSLFCGLFIVVGVLLAIMTWLIYTQTRQSLNNPFSK